MKRGAKPIYLCPDAAELRRSIALHDCLGDVGRHYGIGRKTLHRWMSECGIELPPLRKMRPRGVTPRYVVTARLPGGKRATPKLYSVWSGMRKRCHKPSHINYPQYGARGIRVCDEWRDSYDAFRAWALSHGFDRALTLDRIDGTKGYSPDNCRWATRKEQTYNCKSVYKLTLNGVTKLLPEWARELNLPMEVLRVRKRSGWSDELALTLPKGAMRPGVLRGRAAAKAKRLSSQTSNDTGLPR